MVLKAMAESAERMYVGSPGKFAKLLKVLVTGGENTVPAYRYLLRADSEPGWSGAIQKDFAAGAGTQLGAKLGGSPVIKTNLGDIASGKQRTYVKITYMVGGGNPYGTSVMFEPAVDFSKVSVVVSNLLSKGGRGY